MKNMLFAGLMIGFACLLQYCAQPCKSGSNYYPLSDQLKKYSFAAGSYWIYQDSASGIIDSQSVYKYSIQNHVFASTSPLGNGAWCDNYTDVFSMFVTSFWNGALHDSICFGNGINGINADDIQVSFSSTSQANIYDFSTYSGNHAATLNNFSVLGQTFPIVYRDNSIFNSQIYHADNVGVVRWVFNDTINGQYTWNLMRYHVITP
jgi:hypothetical protein